MPKVKKDRTKTATPVTTTDDYFEQLAEATAVDQAAWSDADYSGQLAVDVYQTDEDIVIRAAIAGVQAENIDISVNDDMVTIKGVRQLDQDVPDSSFLYQECYWGGFSRTVILPVEVDAANVKATMKNGILLVVLPKAERLAVPPIAVIDEDEE